MFVKNSLTRYLPRALSALCVSVHVRLHVYVPVRLCAQSCVARALNVGTNPVIVALVEGDLEGLIQSMDCAG